MKKSTFFKRLAEDFLRAVPELKAQEDVLKSAQGVHELTLFVQAVRRAQERQGLSKMITATSAVPLTIKERDALKEKLTDLWHMPICLEERVEPSVISGLLLSSEDWQHDTTVQGKLRRLEHTLTT